ncbi:MAG: DUF4212 domain-containing protein [Hyphomicrobiaceae bacterium]
MTSDAPSPVPQAPQPQATADPSSGIGVYWQRTRRLAILALLGWMFFVLLVPMAAQQLEAVAVMGIPLGYYAASQGILLALAILLLVSAIRQRRIDRITTSDASAHARGRSGANK